MMTTRLIWIGTCAACALSASTAFAFPPTVTTSPGYDRALAESRKARQMPPPPVFVEPVPQPMKPKPRRTHRR